MVQSRVGNNTVQIALRVPSELRERVKIVADHNGRSVNSELVATLEEKYPAPIHPIDEIFHQIMRIGTYYNPEGIKTDDLQAVAEMCDIVLSNLTGGNTRVDFVYDPDGDKPPEITMYNVDGEIYDWNDLKGPMKIQQTKSPRVRFSELAQKILKTPRPKPEDDSL